MIIDSQFRKRITMEGDSKMAEAIDKSVDSASVKMIEKAAAD